MDPEDFKAGRERLGLTQDQLARLLGLGPNGLRDVQRWEAPEGTSTARKPNTVAAQVMRWLLAGFRPPGWPL